MKTIVLSKYDVCWLKNKQILRGEEIKEIIADPEMLWIGKKVKAEYAIFCVTNANRDIPINGYSIYAQKYIRCHDERENMLGYMILFCGRSIEIKKQYFTGKRKNEGQLPCIKNKRKNRKLG